MTRDSRAGPVLLILPVHGCPVLGVLHVVFEWLSDVARDVDCLDFEGAKVGDLPSIVIRDKDEVDIPRRFVMLIF